MKKKFLIADINSPEIRLLKNSFLLSEFSKYYPVGKKKIKVFLYDDDGFDEPMVWTADMYYLSSINRYLIDYNLDTVKPFSQSEFVNDYTVEEILGTDKPSLHS